MNTSIILEERLDDEAIDDLRTLEREMYLQGDMRSDVLRRVLDLLYMHEIIDDEFSPPKSAIESEIIVAKHPSVISDECIKRKVAECLKVPEEQVIVCSVVQRKVSLLVNRKAWESKLTPTGRWSDRFLRPV